MDNRMNIPVTAAEKKWHGPTVSAVGRETVAGS